MVSSLGVSMDLVEGHVQNGTIQCWELCTDQILSKIKAIGKLRTHDLMTLTREESLD